MNARPKAGEDEEDLLKLQAQFLQGGQASAAGVCIKKPDKRGNSDTTAHAATRDVVKMDISEVSSTDLTPPKRSKFHMAQTTKADENVEVEEESMDDGDVEERMEKSDTGFAAVLSSIIERDTRNEQVSAPLLSRQAFPSVIQNDRLDQPVPKQDSSSSQGMVKKKSLFAQHIEAKSAQHFGVSKSPVPRKLDAPRSKASDKSDFPPERSYVVSGKGLSMSHGQRESEIIHGENMEKLSSLTESEILDEQRKLLESADPNILQFLKNRRSKQQSTDATSLNDEHSETAPGTIKSLKPPAKSLENKDFDLPVKPSKKWLNMGTIEKEKMEWMTDLPPPDSLSSQTGKSARFDFEGDVVAVDSNIPVNQGLHHHGDEPERAGYTLQELFTLARSANLQQRSLALHTVAKIIRMAKCGALADKVEASMIPVLLDGGVLILIRMSMDDHVEGVVFAAVDALHALLCSPLDQEAVSKTWIHHMGNILPSLVPLNTLQKQSEPEDLDENNQEQETDADVIKRDVILALVKRMQLLDRFHYILEVMRPQAVVVKAMMDILARVAQHSINLAYEVMKHKGIIPKIVKEFLPTSWSPQDASDAVSNVYGLPVPSALRLIRCLCQAGRHITATLISNSHLLTVLIRYLAVDEGGLHLPPLEAVHLQTEALAVWRVCVAYGHGLQIFFDLYSENVIKVGKMEKEWSEAMASEKVSCASFMKEANLVCVLERILYNVGQQFQESPVQQSQQFGPSVSWSHVTCLFQPIRDCVCSMLKSIGQEYPIKKHNLSLPTSCVNFLASFYEAEERQSGLDVLSRAEDLENFVGDCFGPFLSSFGFSVLVDYLCQYSNILSSAKSSYNETTASLPSMGLWWSYSSPESMEGITQDERKLNMPILSEHSPFGFIVSILRLSLNVCKRHKGLIDKVIAPLINRPSILLYMKKICQNPDSVYGLSFWTRTENLFQFYWLKGCLMSPCEDMTVAHRVSLRLLHRLQAGDEHLVHDLFTSTIFSPLFIREGDEMQLASQALADMNLSERLYLKSATQEEISLSQGQLLREAIKSLATIRGHFMMALGGMQREVVQSRNLYCGRPTETVCQMYPSQGDGLMPQDWTYLPLIHVYNKSQQMKEVTNTASSQDVSMVTSVIQWNYMYEIWRPREVDHTSITTKVSRIMCAFLAGNDLFLEKKVQTFLAGLLRQFVCPRILNALNFEERVPGITSFYDLYQDFLDHYEGVSFGDPVFGLYVLLPLQQKHSSLYRKAVWGERRKLLRTLRVTFHDCLIPVENFLEKEEEDIELLQFYLQALIKKSIQPAWSPIMYLVAVHHVNRFLFLTYDDGKRNLRDKMWKATLDHFETMSPVIHYKKFNIESHQGLELYEELPDNRKAVFDLHSANRSK